MADLFGDEGLENEEEQQDMLPEEGEGDEEDILDMGEENNNQQHDALLMRFCPHDSSMLYPQVSIYSLIIDCWYV